MMILCYLGDKVNLGAFYIYVLIVLSFGGCFQMSKITFHIFGEGYCCDMQEHN